MPETQSIEIKLGLVDNITPALVKMILLNHRHFEWTLQGFGMLRTYIGKELRLHVWDSRFQVDDVTQMHTHPWNFRSLVVAGQVENVRYVERPEWQAFDRYEILCGEGGHITSEPEQVYLSAEPPEIYAAGHVYSQEANEIHSSHPLDGTVTLIYREFLDDEDHAYVYCEQGKEWISAEPRAATPAEVGAICQNALERWFA